MLKHKSYLIVFLVSNFMALLSLVFLPNALLIGSEE